jgi:hypothetical protein
VIGAPQLIPAVIPLIVLLPILVPAAVAVGVAIGTVWQKHKTDKREAWWKRVQWAMEAASTPGVEYELRRSMGLAMLNALLDERAATPEDQALILAVADNVLEGTSGRRELDFWDSVLKEVDGDE